MQTVGQGIKFSSFLFVNRIFLFQLSFISLMTRCLLFEERDVKCQNGYVTRVSQASEHYKNEMLYKQKVWGKKFSFDA